MMVIGNQSYPWEREDFFILAETRCNNRVGEDDRFDVSFEQGRRRHAHKTKMSLVEPEELLHVRLEGPRQHGDGSSIQPRQAGH